MLYDWIMLYSSGISFAQEPVLFTHLQNKDDDFLLSVSEKLMRSYRTSFAFILTCDRAEVISEEPVSIEVLVRALSLNPAAMRPFRYSYEGEYAKKRIFLLSTGILSPLFGEDTIIGQIAKSLEIGRAAGTLSPHLSKLLNMAAAFGKRMHSEMKIRVFDSTIVSEMVLRLSGHDHILIVGSGDGARLLAQALAGDHHVAMTLRDMSKTFLVPPGVEAVPYDDRRLYAAGSDAVISVTSGLYHTFEEDDKPLLAGKLLFDFSSPHDIPDSFRAVHVEDLGIDLPERRSVVDRIGSKAEAECAAYEAWLAREGEMDAIQVKAESIAYEAIRRLSAPLSRLDKDDEKAFREAVYDSVRKAVVSKEMELRKP